MPPPDYHLEIGSGTHAEQTARILLKIEKILINEQPSVVLVQGDTNSVLASALTAAKLNLPLAHVEAGLRSYDRTMPEELNRILTDHMSDFLFAPTTETKQNLINEGIQQDKIFVTGNTIVDAVLENNKISALKSTILNQLGIVSEKYFVLTVHRAENVDKKHRLISILKGVQNVAKYYDLPVIWPVHPRVNSRLEKAYLEKIISRIPTLKLIKPLGYFDFFKTYESC